MIKAGCEPKRKKLQKALKHCMPTYHRDSDEELTAVRVLASIRHGQQVRLGMLQLEVLRTQRESIKGADGRSMCVRARARTSSSNLLP